MRLLNWEYMCIQKMNIGWAVLLFALVFPFGYLVIELIWALIWTDDKNKIKIHQKGIFSCLNYAGVTCKIVSSIWNRLLFEHTRSNDGKKNQTGLGSQPRCDNKYIAFSWMRTAVSDIHSIWHIHSIICWWFIHKFPSVFFRRKALVLREYRTHSHFLWEKSLWKWKI